MTDMEQQMIEQAKAGDPKAQYEMSLWARQMSILEPGQERWSRLAAKCLVDAAQAGYEPAQIMVQKLMSGESAESASASETAEPAKPAEEAKPVYGTPAPENRFFDDFGTEPQPTPAAERSVYDQAEEDDYDAGEKAEPAAQPEQGFMAVLKKVLAVLKKGGMIAAAAVGGLVTTIREKSKKAPAAGRAAEKPQESESRASRRSSGKGNILDLFNDWVEENKRVALIVGGVVLAVLIGLLILLLATPAEEPEPEVPPVVAETMVPTPSPTPEPFPNEATKLEISSTPTLQYRPGDSDASYYLPASTSFTVKAEVETDEGENLRQGPNSYDYPEVIVRIPNGTKVTAYARYENDDGVVWYLINSGGTWGWMYGPSLS